MARRSFLFRVNSFLDALDRVAPGGLAQARAAFSGAQHAGERIMPDRAAFEACPSDLIDYAIMEKADRVAVVPVDLGWPDVGSWDALYDLGPSDNGGNVVRGDARLREASGCLVRSDGARISMLGLSDLIVVATADAIMFLPCSRSQEAKRPLD